MNKRGRKNKFGIKTGQDIYRQILSKIGVVTVLISEERSNGPVPGTGQLIVGLWKP